MEAIAPDIAEFVREEVAAGRYPDEAAVLREALRLLRERNEQRERRLEELRAEIAVGLADIERGDVDAWDVEELIAECHAEMAIRGGAA